MTATEKLLTDLVGYVLVHSPQLAECRCGACPVCAAGRAVRKAAAEAKFTAAMAAARKQYDLDTADAAETRRIKESQAREDFYVETAPARQKLSEAEKAARAAYEKEKDA